MSENKSRNEVQHEIFVMTMSALCAYIAYARDSLPESDSKDVSIIGAINAVLTFGFSNCEKESFTEIMHKLINHQIAVIDKGEAQFTKTDLQNTIKDGMPHLLGVIQETMEQGLIISGDERPRRDKYDDMLDELKKKASE